MAAGLPGEAQFIAHITKAGERWDLLAWRYYGDPSLYNPIIQFNASIPIDPVFESGLFVAIPMLVASASLSQQTNLPPWKRQN